MHSTRDTCYCGNNFTSGTTKSDTGCTMQCTGNSSESCGGSNLQYYQSVYGHCKSTSFLILNCFLK